MTKKLITLSINQKLMKINFGDVRRVISKKPRKYPQIPDFDPELRSLKESQKLKELDHYKAETDASQC